MFYRLSLSFWNQTKNEQIKICMNRRLTVKLILSSRKQSLCIHNIIQSVRTDTATRFPRTARFFALFYLEDTQLVFVTGKKTWYDDFRSLGPPVHLRLVTDKAIIAENGQKSVVLIIYVNRRLYTLQYACSIRTAVHNS